MKVRLVVAELPSAEEASEAIPLRELLSPVYATACRVSK
jgi:hypothetical protein